METIALKVVLALVGLAATTHVGSKIYSWISGKLHPVQLHTASPRLNEAVEALTTAAEDVVLHTLSGDLLDKLLATVASGGGGPQIVSVLTGVLPQLLANVKNAVGPLVQKELEVLLGSPGAADDRARQAIVGAAQNLALKKITTLPDGRKLVATA